MFSLLSKLYYIILYYILYSNHIKSNQNFTFSLSFSFSCIIISYHILSRILIHSYIKMTKRTAAFAHQIITKELDQFINSSMPQSTNRSSESNLSISAEHSLILLALVPYLLEWGRVTFSLSVISTANCPPSTPNSQIPNIQTLNPNLNI
jgi:hypothetical protein